MAIEDDIAAALPDPPTPRPARRETAIGDAMRRFDAAGDTPVMDRPRAVAPKPKRGWIGGPQIAALAGVALVVTIGVPMWKAGDLGLSPPEREAPMAAPSVAATAETPAIRTVPSTAPGAMAPPAPPTTGASPKVTTPSIVANNPFAAPTVPIPMTRAPSPQSENSAQGEEMADAPPPPPPPPPAPAESIATAPAPAIASARVAMNDNDIIVTGSRVRSPKPLPRGDWNACTIDDPKRDLSACRKQIDLSVPGVDGRAAAHLADGLSLAWQGESTAAIAAFDRTIALAPRDAVAFLNRALAYHRSGNLDRAIADLDQAVRLAPNIARYRYHRSVLLRQKGDTRKAEADERRAIDLDSRYEAVIR